MAVFCVQKGSCMCGKCSERDEDGFPIDARFRLKREREDVFVDLDTGQRFRAKKPRTGKYRLVPVFEERLNWKTEKGFSAMQLILSCLGAVGEFVLWSENENQEMQLKEWIRQEYRSVSGPPVRHARCGETTTTSSIFNLSQGHHVGCSCFSVAAKHANLRLKLLADVDSESPVFKYLHEAQQRRLIKDRRSHDSIVDCSEQVRNLNLPYVRVSDRGSVSTVVRYKGKDLCLTSRSVEEAKHASLLANEVQKQDKKEREDGLYKELSDLYLQQQKDGRTTGGLPSDFDSMPDKGNLGFLAISERDQSLALQQIRNKAEWQERNMKQAFAKDLKKCARCSFVFKWHDLQRAYCLSCETAVGKERRYGWRTAAQLHVKNSKVSSEARNGRKRKDGTHRVMAASEMTLEDVAQKLEIQHFRCAVSNLWLHACNMSPERKNEDETYVFDNWCLVHIAFQSCQKQWTKEKVSLVPVLRRKPAVEVDYENLFGWCKYYEDHEDLKRKEVWSRKLPNSEHKGKKKVQVKEGEGDWITFPTGTEVKDKYKLTSTIKAIADKRSLPPFGTEIRYAPDVFDTQPVKHRSVLKASEETGCSASAISQICHGIGDTAHGHTFWFDVRSKRPKGELPEIFRIARSWIYGTETNTKRRNEKRKKDGRVPLADPKLSIKDCIEMIQHQRGRCAYLDIPLVFESDTEWQATIERKDRDIGYIRDNCCIVVGEVNTASYQWSREFAEKVWPV